MKISSFLKMFFYLESSSIQDFLDSYRQYCQLLCSYISFS
ncbi:hypothetical protein Zm00014a_010703 [Zea mays]|uniref:Uncharacterized protein n=1 Tax=Zea mays TaxID=4577 RepID=A0A3L6D7Y7_MAIZE|nr:hypothetical protein Zm00014a_010703 [Zea mays]